MTEQELNRLCICNNKQNPHIFDMSKAVGTCIADKRCPECGQWFTFMNPPRWLDKYLYVNDDPKYYKY